MAKVPLHERWQERSDAARVEQAETRLAETLARLEVLEAEYRGWAKDYSALSEDFLYFRGKEHAYQTAAEEINEILRLAR